MATRLGLPLCAFSEMHSIQLLDEKVRRTSEPMFWSYELNLVHCNSKGIHLIDHDNQRKIGWDTSDFLPIIDVSVWDFIGYEKPDHVLDPDQVKARILKHIV